MPDKSNKGLILGGSAVGVVVVLGLVIYLLNKPIGPAKPPADPEAARVEEALNALDHLCLSNYSASEKAEVKAQVAPALQSITAGSSADHSQEVLRGAAKTLSEAGQLKDGAEIRACMERNLPTFLATFHVASAAAAAPAGADAEQYPAPFETRLVARFQPAGAGAADSGKMVVALRSESRIYPRDYQDTQPGKYYHIFPPYPGPGETWKGAIGPASWEETPAAGRFAKICFKRPPRYSRQSDAYVLLNCEDGQVCALDSYSPKWVDICDPDAQASAGTKASLWRAWPR